MNHSSKEEVRSKRKARVCLPKTLALRLCPAIAPLHARFMSTAALVTPSGCCGLPPPTPATAQQSLGHKPPLLKPVNTQQKRGQNHPAFLFFQTPHRTKGDWSCEQNVLLLPLYFPYKGNDFRSISVSLPSLTAQVWFPQACQLSCAPTSHPQVCRSCKSSRFGHCRSEVTTPTSQGLPYSNLLAQKSGCDLSNCHPCKINQRGENPLCHSSPLIKVLPPELSSQFCCQCTRQEATVFTLTELLWLCQVLQKACTHQRPAQAWLQVVYT